MRKEKNKIKRPVLAHQPTQSRIDTKKPPQGGSGLNKIQEKDPLIERILEYLKIKGIGQAISLSCDISLRRRLAKYSIDVDTGKWQDRVADEDLEILNKGKKYCDIDEPLYKAIELGELLKCLELFGECKYAKCCWVTRKGFCQRRRQEELHND